MKTIIGYFHTINGEPANFSEKHNQLFFTQRDIVIVKTYRQILSERRKDKKTNPNIFGGKKAFGAKRVVIIE